MKNLLPWLKTKFKKQAHVIVYWEDTRSDPTWRDEAELDEFGIAICRTKGLIHKETPTELKLNHTTTSNEDGHAGDITTIPNSCIIAVFNQTHNGERKGKYEYGARAKYVEGL